MVVGGGMVALRKAQSLLQADARVVVVSPQFDDRLLALGQSTSNLQLIKSKYSKANLTDAVLVIAATNDNELNEQVYKDCQQLEIICNVVDKPKLCDFFVPAVVKRGDLQIAIGSEGRCPAYSGHLRKKLEKLFTEKHGEFLIQLEKQRQHIIEKIPTETQRRTILGELVKDSSFDYFAQNGTEQWQKWAENITAEFQNQPSA